MDACWREDLWESFTLCKSALFSGLPYTTEEPEVKKICDVTAQQLLDVEPYLTGEPWVFACLRALVTAYLEIFRLRGGAEVKHQLAAAKVQEASRHLRDAVVSCCFGLMEGDSREEFLWYLVQASDGKIGEEGPEGENLKSSLLKACHALFGNLPSTEQTKAKRKRAACACNKQRAAETQGYEEAAYYFPQYQQAYYYEAPFASNPWPCVVWLLHS